MKFMQSRRANNERCNRLPSIAFYSFVLYCPLRFFVWRGLRCDRSQVRFYQSDHRLDCLQRCLRGLHVGGVQMNATISINPARSNLAKLWTAWQVISVVLLTGYSVVFFTSLGNTPQSRLIYLAIALLLPVIACVAWAVAFTCYYQHRYFWAATIFILGTLLTLPTIATGGLQMAINWGLFA